MPGYVYELSDPRTSRSFYIGMTEDPCRRLGEHLKGHVNLTAARIKEITGAGLEPTMSIRAQLASPKEAHRIEQQMIAAARRAGLPLCNTAAGRQLEPAIARHGRGWSADEQEQAVRMFDEGVCARAIAVQFQRTTSAVKKVLRRAGRLKPNAV